MGLAFWQEFQAANLNAKALDRLGEVAGKPQMGLGKSPRADHNNSPAD
ncbi:MAG: hypothetical protein ACK53L_29060 [Pirellulaceae bacterium]